MAKIKVINKRQNADLIGGNFTNDASQTIFSLGAFSVQSNFTGRKITKYENKITSFVTPITLENLKLTENESNQIVSLTSNVVLNLDKSDLKSYAKFGSTKEILRVAVQEIIKKFPASLFAYKNITVNGNFTIANFIYDPVTNISTFEVPKQYIDNKFGIVTARNNFATPDNSEIRNLNLSYQNYVIWKGSDPDNNKHYILGYTGDTIQDPILRFKVNGNPFPEISGNTASTASINYHIKPNPRQYNLFYSKLEPLQKHLLSRRTDDNSGFITEFKEPVLLDDGNTIFTERSFIWTTFDQYNIDIDSSQYSQYLVSLMNLGELYDSFKTDLVYRLLTTTSLKVYDQTDEMKMSKLLRIYGREFDNIRQYIDAIAYANTVTYNKKNNLSDTLVKNLAKTLGWNTVNLVSDEDLENAFFSEFETEENQIRLPYEIDIELWRRIIINTNYYWKSKGTRAALKSMLRLIGIPEPFVDITEYVYTVDGRINPNRVNLTLEDIGAPSLPYNSQGYPIAPKENNDFFFQISGDTDGGQEYINLFRRVGFSVNRIVDNKKSWEEAGFVERKHYSSPAYFQRDSKLIINTKEIDATLDTARGIEYDVYTYNKLTNYPISTTGVTKPYLYINIPFTYGESANTFTVINGETALGDIQVNFNGITLEKGVDYVQLSNTTVQLINEYARKHSNGSKDVITLTYLHDRYNGLSGDYSSIQYIVTTITALPSGVEIPLPPNYTLSDSGDIQLTINGISLTKSTSLFTGDYIIAPTKDKIVVQNASLVTYLQSNPTVMISYIEQLNNEGLNKKFEVHRVDSFSSNKLSFNAGINKFIYNMNYEAIDIASIKVTINGITLQNGTDFTLNSGNKYQIFLPASLNYGDVIGVYYVVGEGTQSSFLPSNLIFPNVSELSFLEYLELVTRKLINAKTRKIITDNNGGFYPTVLKIYEEYLKVSFLPENNFYHSNGYTFSNVFPFIAKFSTFFERFITDLLPATVILRKGGTLIRNTSFTRQKFTYKRGVNFDPSLEWLGDDGSEFKTKQAKTIYSWADASVCVSQPILFIEDVEVITSS